PLADGREACRSDGRQMRSGASNCPRLVAHVHAEPRGGRGPSQEGSNGVFPMRRKETGRAKHGVAGCHGLRPHLQDEKSTSRSHEITRITRKLLLSKALGSKRRSPMDKAYVCCVLLAGLAVVGCASQGQFLDTKQDMALQ